MPDLDAALGLAMASIPNEPLPVRLDGCIFVIVNQLTLLLVFQVLVDSTLILVLLVLDDGTFQVAVDSSSIAGGAGWVTVIVLVIPSAVTVIVPVLSVVFMALDAASILKLPLPVRLAGVMLFMVNHVALLVGILQVLVENTFIVVWLKAADDVFQLLCDRVNSAAGGGWVTVIVRVTPAPVTVIVPVRAVVPVLTNAFILNTPSLVRLLGNTSEIVSHETLLLGLLQVRVDLTFTVTPPAADDGTLQLGIDNVSIAGESWVTVMVRVIPLADTVTVPVLDVVPVLADAVILKLPLFVRLVGFIFAMVSQLALLLGIPQVVFDNTFTVS